MNTVILRFPTKSIMDFSISPVRNNGKSSSFTRCANAASTTGQMFIFKKDIRFSWRIFSLHNFRQFVMFPLYLFFIHLYLLCILSICLLQTTDVGKQANK